MIKLVKTIAPSVRARKVSTLCSMLASGFEASKSANGDKLNIPVPNIV